MPWFFKIETPNLSPGGLWSYTFTMVQDTPLLASTLANTAEWTWRAVFPTKRTPANVLKCIDGDTLLVCLDPVGVDGVYAFRIRLLGYNSPELHPRHLSDDGTRRTNEDLESERERAREAKHALEEMVVGNIVYVDINGQDHFGRLLAHMEASDGRDVVSTLIAGGYGVPFMTDSDPERDAHFFAGK